MRCDIEQIDLASNRLGDRELPPPAPKRSPKLDEPTQKRIKNVFEASGLSEVEFERTIGSHDLVDQFYLERALVAAKPVCRIAVRDDALHTVGFATGFMVSPTLLLTNWHVFKTSEAARFSYVQFDYTYAINGDEIEGVTFDLDPATFYYSNRALDCALVAVQARSRDRTRELSEFGFHRLNPNPWKITPPEWITIVQHPGGARRQYAIRENELLPPLEGEFLWYRSDTAQGSSGAPAFNDSFQIVALHHSGKAKKQGDRFVLRDQTLVDSLEDIDESRIQWVANEGVRASVLCKHFDKALDKKKKLVVELFNAIQGEHDIMSTVLRRGNGQRRGGNVEIIDLGTLTKPLTRRDEPDGPPEREPDAHTQPVRVHANGTTLQIPLTLHITVSVGTASAAVIDAPATNDHSFGEEKIVIPPIDPDYANRKGYRDDFLRENVPLPTPTNVASLAKMEDGEVVIPYEHFSLVMNKQRRLALYTISNVHGAAKKRRPEEGRSYTRRALGNLVSKNDKEGWLTDPRIPAQHQLPEKFYDHDGAAFDKGHLVRREDVCWGNSYEQVQKANADTFHTTNCSPQVATFNRSQFDGLWGELENEILRQVKGDRYTLIAGPVLDPTDKWFDGKDLRGKIRIQIPSRYWKVVVTHADRQLRAFAFLLEQDLDAVKLQEEEDFEVPARFSTRLISLAHLEELVELTFAKMLHDADQHDKEGGEELVRTTSARRGGPRGRVLDEVRPETRPT